MSNLKNQDMKASIGNLHKLDIEKISSIYWVEPISLAETIYKTNHILRCKSVTRRCKQSDSIIQTVCYQHFIMREFFTTSNLGCRCK